MLASRGGDGMFRAVFLIPHALPTVQSIERTDYTQSQDLVRHIFLIDGAISHGKEHCATPNSLFWPVSLTARGARDQGGSRRSRGTVAAERGGNRLRQAGTIAVAVIIMNPTFAEAVSLLALTGSQKWR